MEIAINDGADDCISTDFFHEITTKKENFYKVKTKIEKRISDFISAEIGWKPLNKIVLNKEKSKVAIDFLERLEDDDDGITLEEHLMKAEDSLPLPSASAQIGPNYGSVIEPDPTLLGLGLLGLIFLIVVPTALVILVVIAIKMR